MTPNQSHVAGLEYARLIAEKNRPLDVQLEMLSDAIAQAKATPAEPDEGEAFCDGHCTWLDHHPECPRAEPTEPTEAVEVVAWLSPETTEAVIPGAGYDLLVSEDCHLEPLMTVAQHKRLMAAKDGELVELLAKLRQMVCATPKNDIDRSGVWISTKHPVIERIDALLGGAG